MTLPENCFILPAMAPQQLRSNMKTPLRFLSVAGICATLFLTAATPSALAQATPTPAPILPLIRKGPIRIELEALTGNFSGPVDLLNAGDSRLFVIEQQGKIRILKNDAVTSTPFLDVSARLVSLTDERGLLGVAFYPGYADPASPGYRKFYTYTSEPVSGPADFTVPINGAFNHQSVVAEWQVSTSNPDVADPASRREVLRIDEPQSNHNGGKLAFRPGDGYLYISFGDGGSGNDTATGHTPGIGNGQDLTTVLGKILRIDPLNPALTNASLDPRSANGKYRVPASNPFVGRANVLAEIFAYGFRNPFRFSFDPTTDRFLVGDVGQGNVEEVDLVEAGKNYGWNRKEGSFLFNSANSHVAFDPSPDPTLINPLLEYSHSDGRAVIGGVVERGNRVPALSGLYIFGDYYAVNAGRLFYSDLGADGLIQELRLGTTDRSFGKALKGIGTDNRGEVYLLGDGGGGTVYRVVSIPPAPAILNLSTRLKVGQGDDSAIAGFIITGSEKEEVVLRGIGPSLAAQGAPLRGRLPNPKIELRNGAGRLIAANDDWMGGANQAELRRLRLQPTDKLESALVAQLDPGSYTVVLRDAKGATGIGLVELYALQAAANPANISTRGFVRTGDNVMIGGFILGGEQPRNLYLRALGPSLAAQNVDDPLLDPVLELRDANGALLQSNNNWRDTQEAEIESAGLPPGDDREAALLATLTPGNYTAIVKGRNKTTGVALVEVYDLPQ